MAQLYFIPADGRTITRRGIEAEIEYIGGEYYTAPIISDLLDAGAIIKLSRRDPRRSKAEKETRTVTIAQLFSVIYDETGAEDVLEDLRTKTDTQLFQLSKAWLS